MAIERTHAGCRSHSLDEADLAADLISGVLDEAADPPQVFGLSRLKGAGAAGMSVVQMALISRGEDPTGRFAGLRALTAVLRHELASLKRAKKPPARTG